MALNLGEMEIRVTLVVQAGQWEAREPVGVVVMKAGAYESVCPPPMPPVDLRAALLRLADRLAPEGA